MRLRLNAKRPARLREPGAVEASVAIVLSPRAPAGGGSHRRLSRSVEVLLIVRAERPEDPWSGQVSFPGGRREPRDRDRLATALRETREETGLRLSAGSLLGQADDHYPRSKTLPPVIVRPFVFGLGARPALTPGPEAAACLWADLSDLRASAFEARVPSGRLPRVPAFRAGGRVVWGITYRLLLPVMDALNIPAAGTFQGGAPTGYRT